jgi:hypothetical protein
MNVSSILLVATIFTAVAPAAIVKVTITGTVKDIHISEGPVFGHTSREHIPDGTPFTLTYMFDDTKGEDRIQTESHGKITRSGLRALRAAASPGTDAILQIGGGVWDFGESVDSEVALTTAVRVKSYVIRFSTTDKDNWISSNVYPGKGGSWPSTADWRQSFHASGLEKNPSSFSIDNGTVSVRGSLIASEISVNGVHLEGQALSFTTVDGGPNSANWVRQWHLAKPSPHGGCVIESVTKTVVGTTPHNGAPITPFLTKYWVAWRVAPGAKITIPATDDFQSSYPRGSTGTLTISATARFYEGTGVPPSFIASNLPSLSGRLSSNSDPGLATSHATLPITVTATLRF